ncbi:hypothetical protein [Flavilitoribacter nigricans]|uniref:Uncharacterized protein n=1 Tax=Flavilitoribacter nigricans (strain ATCC 23147 / DSM 23189 / NBRC 102662 / NCIMB 1420 / SS-2) TaxID=1122177 RepID=A0A2D0N2Q0_FLAN2|nr:hypothetical protein [Flavilitoribacter nigricans]PHN02775.1 hypothetical protein CRP01_30805 [Flavilitoribacter nigricans DSM 23189 = NBRC 102662]
MKSEEKVDAILESMREEVQQFLEEESQITSSTEYEERVIELSRKFARGLISKSQGQLPKSRNSKKVLTSLGRVELRKDHTLSKGTLKFGISERIRGLLCLLGQSVVYEEASELFATMLGIDVCTPPIQRVCTHYGKAIDPLVKANCKAVIPPRLESGKGQDKMYVM